MRRKSAAHWIDRMRGRLRVITSSEEETIRLGASIGQALRPGAVALLLGELGAGKTRLAKGLVSGATGVDPDEVVSPTFTLINRFDGPIPVFHADLYRLEGPDADDIGLDEAFESGGALVVEWPEKRNWADTDPLTISIEYGEDETSRILTMEWREDGSWSEIMKHLHFPGEVV